MGTPHVHISCPGCSTRYALPDHLLGPAGARVCCPSCWLTFVIDAAGRPVSVLGRAEPPGMTPPAAANGAAHPHDADLGPALESLESHELPESLAVVRRLDSPSGTLARAAEAGRLFADHGPALLDAFEMLALARPAAGVAAEFRMALAHVAGLDLSRPIESADAPSAD